MPIEFTCPVCNTEIRTPDATAGKKGKCPSCAAVLRIPGGASTETPKAAPPTPAPKPAAAAPKPTPSKPAPIQPAAEPEDTGPLEFFCSVCGQIVRTPRSAAGKKGKCPHCNGVIQIPLKSRAVKTNPPAATQPAKPKAPPTPPPKPPKPKQPELGLAPLDDLTPLDEPAPSPARKPTRPPADDFRAPTPIHKPKNPNIPPSESFLKPMSDSLDGLDPLGTDPFGGYGVAPDPFGALGPLGAGSSGGVSLPVASPFAPAAASGPAEAIPGGPPGANVRKPIAPILVILPAIFQLLAIIPFLLFNMFVISSMVYTFLVVGAQGAVLPADSMTKLVLYSVVLLLVFAIQIWAIFGSINMMQFRNHDNAIASAYISLVPCFGFCGIPFGIWSLIVLNDRGVKRMFTDN